MRKAMLVNDSRLETMILTDMLKTVGYQVRVSDELRALEDLKSDKPDVVFVNYIMKSMRGDSLIGMMKLLQPNLICVLTTSNEVSMDAFKHRKVDAVLHTPTSPDKIKTVVQEIEDRHAN